MTPTCPFLTPSFVGNPFIQCHKILSQNTKDYETSYGVNSVSISPGLRMVPGHDRHQELIHAIAMLALTHNKKIQTARKSKNLPLSLLWRHQAPFVVQHLQMLKHNQLTDQTECHKPQINQQNTGPITVTNSTSITKFFCNQQIFQSNARWGYSARPFTSHKRLKSKKSHTLAVA